MADDTNTAPGRGGAPQATQNPPNNPPQDQPEGFWHSVATSVGIDPEAVKATAKAFRDHPVEAAKAVADEFGSETEEAGKQIVQHPLDSANQVAYGAASAVEDPNAHQRAIDEMKQPGVMPKVAGAEEYLEATIPFIGGGIEKSQEQANAGNYKGAAGTLTGTIVPPLVGGEGATAEGAAERGASAGAEEAVSQPKFADIGGKEVLPAEKSPSGQETQAVEKVPEPQYNQALARRGEIPNQNVTLTPAYGDTGKYVGGHNLLTQERQAPLKEPYSIEVTSQDGLVNTENIDAFSPKSAMDIVRKKYPDAYNISLEHFGEREPSEDYTVPTGKHLSLPKNSRPVGEVMRHELGHSMVGSNEGLTINGMLRHTHPDAAKDMSAGVQWAGRDIMDYSGRVKPEKVESVIRTLMGGIAADEVFSNSPRATNRNFDLTLPGSDAEQAFRILKSRGYSNGEAVDMMNNAIDDNKEYLQHPGVSSVVSENADVREPDLSKQYHFSPERLENMHAEAQRRIKNAEPIDKTTGGESGEGSAVVAGTTESGAEGAGQSLKAAHVNTEPAPQSVAPPKEPFKGTHYSPVAIEGDTLSGATRGKAAAGSEKDRLQYENRVPGVYAYREGAQTESQISSRANKYNIGGDKAIADIGPGGEQRAMFQKAHRDAFEQYKASGDIDTVASHKALNDAEAKLRDAGYDGYESKATRPGSVFLFGNQKIEQPAMTAKSLTLEAPPEETEETKTAAPDWNKAAKNFKKNGGFTVNASTGEAPTKGYQVEVGTEQGRTFDHPPTAAEIQQFATDNQDLFEKHPELHVGGYKNGDKYELNVSANAESLPEAKKVAKKLDQISIWDNANAQEIQTGGKSGRREYPNYPIEERLSELKGGTRSDVPDFQHLSKPIYDNMEPDEREYVKGNKTLQNNVMKAYHELQPSVNETTNAMQAGAALGGWWNRYMNIFQNLAGNEEKAAVANTIGPSHAEVLKQWHAALSGNKSVADANNLAWHSYADWLDAGKPTDRKSIDDIIRKNGAQPEGSGKRGNAAISDTLGKKGKILSPGLDTTKLYTLVNSPEMKGEREFHNDVFSDDTKKNPLMGTTIGARKIPSMGATVAGKGNLNRLVIDTHIRDFYGQKSQGPAAQYIADSIHLRQAAKSLGLKGGEGQEQLWGTVLGLKTLLREGLTPPEAAGKLDSDVINQIGKDYAEVIANDPEITKPGGILDRIKEKYGIGVGSEGFGAAHSKTLSASASEGQPGGSEEAVDRSQLGKTAERIRGTIADSRIKKPSEPEEDTSFNFGANAPESAPKKNKKGPVKALDLINLLSNLKAPAVNVK